MRVIVPMAGMGKRLRPHTLFTAKPLLPVAGKPIVERLVEDVCQVCAGKVEEIAYVVGDFGPEVEKRLIETAERLGAKGLIFKQDEPLGTAHAVWQARECLKGEVVVAFADTLFVADFNLDPSKDGVLWVKHVDDPRPFGVVVLDENGDVHSMVEKPQEPVSNLAIIGIYYFKNAEKLSAEIEYLIQNNVRDKGEFQLTDALSRMRAAGAKFGAGEVQAWMDCGNKTNWLETNSEYLKHLAERRSGELSRDNSVKIVNSQIIEPVYIASGAVIEDSVVGPGVSIGKNARVSRSNLQDVILLDNAIVERAVLQNGVVGEFSKVAPEPLAPNLGNYSTWPS